MAENSPITEDHQWFTGQDITFGFTIEGSGSIAGYEMEWVFRQHSDEEEAILHKTMADGVSIVDANARTVAVVIAADDTRELDPVTGHHALKRINSGEERPLAYGSAMLQRVATR